jgi:glycosyltransferase involved in cell wall biosynthesis
MHGRPTVVSGFSYGGFSDVLRPDEHLLVADTPEEFAEKVTAVLDNPQRYAGMAEAGRQVAEAAYSVAAFREHVLATVRETIYEGSL